MNIDSGNISELAMKPANTPVKDDVKTGMNVSKGKEDVEAANIASITAEISSKLNDKKIAEKEINLEEVAQQLQDFVGSLNTSLQFSVDEDSGRDVIKVLEKETGDVVRQFPSEEILDVIKSLSNATGILFDETA